MSNKIILWSDKAKKSYNEILEYLNNRWTEKEIHNFIDRTESVIAKIKSEPQIFKQHNSDPLIREAVVHKTVILIYQISPDKNEINLLTFWGVRQDPERLKL